MLVSLQAVATHLAIAVENLSHVQLSRHLFGKLYSMFCHGEEEEGSLHQLCDWPTSGI